MSKSELDSNGALEDRVVLDGTAEFHRILNSELVRPAVCRLCDGLGLAVFDLAEFLGGLEAQPEVTPHALVFGAGRVPVAARALDRPDLDVLSVVLDVDTVELRVGPFVRLCAEASEVAGGVFGASCSTLPVLDSRCRHAEGDEPPRVRLSEVRRVDIFRDSSAVGGRLEVLVEGGSAGTLRSGEFRPEVGITPSLRRVLLEPLQEVRNGPDQVDGLLALLPIGVDADAVLGVEDIPDAQVPQLTPTEAGLELDGEQRLVAFVLGGVGERLDIVEGEEVALARDGVEVVARPGPDPVEALGRVFLLESVATERAQGRSVVLIGMFIVVLVVDPADDRLRSGAGLEGEPEEAVLPEECFDVVLAFDVEGPGLVVLLEVLHGRPRDELGHPGSVAQELQVAMLADLRGQQADVIGHPEQVLAIGLELDGSIPTPELVSDDVDLVAGGVVSHVSSLYPVACKADPRIRPLALTTNLTIQRLSGGETPGLRHGQESVESYNAIDTSAGGAGQGVAA